MKNQQHREQIADLILTDADGNDLEVCSNITTEQGAFSFEVGNEDARYKVTIEIEEL